MLLRALQLRNAVLVEFLPGVGKTAVMGALASRARVPLVSPFLYHTCIHMVEVVRV